MQERPKTKSIGRKPVPKSETVAKPQPAKAASAKTGGKASAKTARLAAEPAAPAAKAKNAGTGAIELRASERTLLASLAAQTKLTPAEVVARALQSYASAVAPELLRPSLDLSSTPPLEQPNAEESPAERLFASVDGRPEFQIGSREFVFGSGPGCDLQLDLPLIAPRHARVLLREGRHLFEDLRSPKGSYRHGALVDVRFIEDGDEIDLGGFLPVRFRIER